MKNSGHGWLLTLVAVLFSGCQTLPALPDRPPAPAFDRPAETPLGARTESAASTRAGQSGFLILDSGRQAFLQRATLIDAAERSIDAQYYIWNSDVSGRYLAQRLVLAAERGVRVRLLLDDINLAGRDEAIATLDRHPNIEIRVYNPFAKREGIRRWFGFAADFNRLNRRMHNKTFVVDGAYGIVGGRNIGDEYFDLHPQMNFRDRDILAAGPVVRDFSANFDAYWNSTLAYPIDLLAPVVKNEPDWAVLAAEARAVKTVPGAAMLPPPSPEVARGAMQTTLGQMIWARAELIFDPSEQKLGNDGTTPKVTAQTLGRLVTEAKAEILVESAYFILGDAQLETLAPTLGRNVRFAVTTNSLATNDLTTNHSGYARHRQAMLAKGLELHELRPDAAACMTWIEAPDYCTMGKVSLHAKSMVFDRQVLYIGSFNINLRSTYFNSETVLVIYSAELATRVARDIELGMQPENSWQVSRDTDGDLIWAAGSGQTWTHEPETGFWRRCKSGMLSWLSVEEYL